MAMLGFGGRKVEELRVAHAVEVDPRTGSASLSVPVPCTPGRDGMAPQLALAYSSGGANSPFGAGWTLAGLSAVTIDTRLHVPRWDGTDAFALGGDELVPWLDAAGSPRGFVSGDWSVAFLRSRRGTGKTRVEKWLHVPTGRIHFRARDPAGVLTIYGARPGAAARLADPNDEARTFAWLPEVQIDPRGTAIWFEYAPETLDRIERAAPFERAQPSLAQRYLKRLRYGNASELALDDNVLTGALPPQVRWCFQVVLDYGDHGASPLVSPTQLWPARVDPFSTYRAGFEVRTYRLCRRILAFHDFAELGSEPVVVGALALTHDPDPAGTTLREIAYTGYRHGGDKTLPPLRMTYAPTATATAFAEAPATATTNVPAGLADRRCTFVDLFGEGLPGIVTEIDRAWYYKRNHGGGTFGEQTLVLERPATRPGAFQLGDLDRDGNTDATLVAGRLAGVYELDRDEERWRPFRPFSTLPHVEALGGRAQWVDLNGDGRPDIIVACADALVWFASEGDGFAAPIEIPRPWPTDDAPAIAADRALDCFFADMTGEGLPALVRARNGRVEYWPNLGNGRFGDAVVMDGAPRFAPDAEFDSTRLRFVDLDGSGTADLVYLGHGEVTCWINASGNQFVAGPRLEGLPYLDNLSSVRVLDFLGDGRASLVWSSALPGASSPLEYLPLTPATRPRMLLSVEDSLGRATTLSYSSSATHYLRDQAAGRGWSTRLPIHQTVVDRLEVVDRIGATRSLRRYAYHDGYYDGGEREFRGFGHVDVWDADGVDDTEPGPGAAAFAAPAMVRSWFHLGTPMWGHHAPSDFYVKDAALPVLPPHVIDGALAPHELEDGLRALAGRSIRSETYACDEHGVPAADPIEVTQASYRLRRLQPRHGIARAAFSAVPLETATWTYEQASSDPRVAHAIIIETDELDTPTREAKIGYARRAGQPRDVAAQDRAWLDVRDHAVVHFDTPDRYELGIPSEEQRCELVGIRPEGALFTRDELRTGAVTAALAAPGPSHVELTDDPALGARARLITQERMYYWDDARAGALPLGQIGSPTLVHHGESACFAPDLVASVFGIDVDDARLAALGYVLRDGLWWQVGATQQFAGPFLRPTATQRGDGAATHFAWDPYALAIVSVTDPVGVVTKAMIDYHVLAPWQIIDGNGATSEALYDPLGVIVTATAYGHVGAAAWGFDPLASVTAAAPATLTEALANPGALLPLRPLCEAALRLASTSPTMAFCTLFSSTSMH